MFETANPWETKEWTGKHMMRNTKKRRLIRDPDATKLRSRHDASGGQIDTTPGRTHLEKEQEDPSSKLKYIAVGNMSSINFIFPLNQTWNTILEVMFSSIPQNGKCMCAFMRVCMYYIGIYIYMCVCVCLCVCAMECSGVQCNAMLCNAMLWN